MPVIRASNGMGRILGQSAAAVSHTGDTTETTVATITIPAGATGANGRAKVEIDASGVSGTSTKTVRLKLGGTTLWSRVMVSTETAVKATVDIANRNSVSSQRWSSYQINNANTSITQNGTAAIDTSASADLTITIQNANAGDTAALEAYQVILYPKA